MHNLYIMKSDWAPDSSTRVVVLSAPRRGGGGEHNIMLVAFDWFWNFGGGK